VITDAPVTKDTTARAFAGNFDAFVPVPAAYADFQWKHMRTEEEVVLPLAERHLTLEDWQALDAAFAANRERGW
jgi:hemerythrin-like domain-containing protein